MSGPLQLYGGDTAQTPPQFDATTKIPNTQFVKTAGMLMNVFVTYTGSATLTATDCGKAIQVQPGAAGAVMTLPLASTVPSGGMACLKNTSGTYAFTVQRQGSDAISEGNGTSMVVNPLDDLLFVSNGVNSWYPFMGLARLPSYSGFGSSLGTPGFQKLPSGFIIQWGSVLVPANSVSGTITLPLTMPNAILSACLTGQVPPGAAPVGILASSKSTLTVQCGGGNSVSSYYIVVGA